LLKKYVLEMFTTITKIVLTCPGLFYVQIKSSLCQLMSGKRSMKSLPEYMNLVKTVRRLRQHLKKRLFGLFLLYVGLKKGLMKGM